MTDIAVSTQALQAEDLSWDLTPPHGGFDDQGVLGIGAFTQSQHFPNGYIPSGCVLALATGGTYSGLLVPYLDAGSNGAAVACGILKASLTVVRTNGTLLTKIGAAFRVHAYVKVSRLPFNSTNQAAGGYLDADAQVDLNHIYFKA